MKRYFYILLLLSFIFLFIFLVKTEFIIPDLPEPGWIIPSMVMLFLGFYTSTQSWIIALHSHGIRISHGKAIASHGLSIFAKYIPGKIWVILGRAGYIAENKEEVKLNTFVSLKEQMIYTWVGFLISSIPTAIFYRGHWLTYGLILLVIFLSFFLFVRRIHEFAVGILKKWFHLKIDLPFINLRKSVPVILSTAAIWAAWTISFYLFLQAFGTELSPLCAFAFPLSVSFGLIAVFVPGGLGVREGIIVGYLVLAGMEPGLATSIAFFNRFAFIAGEVFIFLLGLAARKKVNNSERRISNIEY